MFQKSRLLFPQSRKIFPVKKTIKQLSSFKRDFEIAPILPALEDTKNHIINLNGFSKEFKSKTVIGIAFHGYGTNMSLLHALLELGFPKHFLYVACKPHSLDERVRKYCKAMGVRYIDFSDYTYKFSEFKETFFEAGTYPTGYYYEAMQQYYSKLVEAQKQDLLRSKLYPLVDSLAIIDEGGRYHAAFDKEKALFENYKIVGLGHSTSDLNGKEKENLTYLTIAMGRAVIKTAIESENISSSNLAMVDSEYPDSIKNELHYGVLGCGNLGINTIRLLITQGKKVFYFDTKPEKYTSFQELIVAHPEKLVAVNSQYDLFQISDVLLSCTGSDVTENIAYSNLTLRDSSPINKKVFFNFASGEKEFGHWLRKSQDKKNPRIIDPRKKDFPEWDLTMADGHTLTIKFSGMPANMMKKGIHNLPKEKAQLIRAMKLAGIYQLDSLLTEMRKIPEQYFQKENRPRNYIDLDPWWQRIILESYCNDMIQQSPRDIIKYQGFLKALPISEIAKQSQCIPQMKLSDFCLSTEHKTLGDSIGENTLYVARKEIINEIDRYFKQPTNNVLIFCLYGIAGVGKTQIANNYYIDNFKNYHTVLYFHAENLASLPDQYKEKLYKHNGQKSFGNEQETINDFIDWMENTPSFLLVYDNVENHKMIEKMLPKMAKNNNEKHSILVTSRTQYGSNHAEVPANMKNNESHELLKKILRNGCYKGNDHAQIDVLTKELHHFPLAIAQAGAAIIDEDNPITITHFLENFKENRALFLTSKKTLPWSSSAHESLYITWMMNKEKLSASSLPWKYVLQVMSVLSPDKIARSLVEEKAIKLITLRENAELYTKNASYFDALAPAFAGLIDHYFNIYNIAHPISSCFYFSILLGLWIFIVDNLGTAYESKLTSNLINNIHTALKKLKRLGIISQTGVSEYGIHRLMQEIFLIDLRSENFVSTLHQMETWTKEVTLILNNTDLKKNDLKNMTSKAQFLLGLFGKPTFFGYYVVIESYVGDFRSPWFIKPYNCEHDGEVNGTEYYFDVLEKYIEFCVRLAQIFIYLKQHDEYKAILNGISLQLCHFYKAIIISDKVIFFDYIQEINKLIDGAHQHLNKISMQNGCSSGNINFDNDSLKIDNLPVISKKQIYRITGLETELQNYINSQKDVLKTNLYSPHFFQNNINNQIRAAEWLLDNLPIPSNVTSVSMEGSAPRFEALESQREALSEEKLKLIIEKYYPLILTENHKDMLKESTQWWLNQKNVKQESPFSSEAKPTSGPKPGDRFF